MGNTYIDYDITKHWMQELTESKNICVWWYRDVSRYISKGQKAHFGSIWLAWSIFFCKIFVDRSMSGKWIMSQQANKVQLAHSLIENSFEVRNNYFMILSQMLDIPKVVAFLSQYLNSHILYRLNRDLCSASTSLEWFGLFFKLMNRFYFKESNDGL